MLSPDSILSRIGSPTDLKALNDKELDQLADEMRGELIGVVGRRAAHFASNLGVVELCLALHLTFDFATDRLIWDTGHQIYPHKLITGRAGELHTIRTRGGLMGYPNPAESPYDLFMTGHAGCAPSTALGLKLGDELMGRTDSHSVAVIGDGAFPSGIVFEALNHASGSQSKLLVILNDNKMSICPPVGGVANALDRARMSKTYHDWNKRLKSLVPTIPLVGETAERWVQQLKDAIKASLQHGMLFEELGFTYLGPIDGHDLKGLRTYLEKVKEMSGPILLHVLTNKGHGFEPAVKDPVKFHAPAPFRKGEGGYVPIKVSSSETYTDAFSAALFDACGRDSRVAVLTAAMCEGNKLQKVRESFPSQFFDVGICESHAVALAGGMAKAGARPVVDVYSTFLQRAYDQIFQEVSLQNLPVVFCLDRAGLVGADGPTHHGSYDLAYMRAFPNMVVMAPGDRRDISPMLDFALGHDAPVSIRYPRANLESVERDVQPIELGQAEVIEWESDGMIIACGSLLGASLQAAARLHARYGLHVGVINARFVKPLDRATIGKAIEEAGFVLTVEEGCLPGGFGSAVLEAANDAGLPTRHVRRLGLPDRFVLHAERDEQLAEVGLDVDGITAAALEMARAVGLEFTDLAAESESGSHPAPASIADGGAHPNANGSAVVAASPSQQ
ncbi:1-deoxy-D-xylulose-5-phosphate synthase [Planctomyces sp. SH-PL62]|uniref:1-deoxy-D-xylulose-5-phosphate synthase n=1 Tax=Planctomyces sp. SH-PL62 TaxID=1636152 RepID=UPI00078D3729|nr:1-deoxy-D-xylulose-5-phosphate synthase [Planctomyces sp. SH-PL62]AMV40376.1 1-deoxy-D-xylulose-5-phosphate synthase [Planctomyces sp. SH-PL62]